MNLTGRRGYYLCLSALVFASAWSCTGAANGRGPLGPFLGPNRATETVNSAKSDIKFRTRVVLSNNLYSSGPWGGLPRRLLALTGAGLSGLSPKSDQVVSEWHWVNPQPEGDTMMNVACNRSQCYAVGYQGRAFTYAQGSSRWHPDATGSSANLYSISCPAGGSCYVVGDFGTILRTSDSGQTWRLYHLATTLVLTKVICLDISTCYAMGQDVSKECRSYCTNPGASNTFFATSDGGVRWKRYQPGTANSLDTMGCPAVNRCLLVGREGYVRSTDDGGVTWQTLTGPGPHTELTGVDCLSISMCYATAYGGRIFITRNSGTTWTPFQAKGFRGLGLGVIDCSSKSTCIAESVNAFYETTDGGVDWHTSQPNGFLNTNSIWCSNGFHCVAVGDSGRMYSTLDGKVWHDFSRGSRAYIFGAQCSGGGNCRMITDQGLLIMTGRGSRWIVRAFPSSLRSLVAEALPFVSSCPTALECFLVSGWGNTGKIIATFDDGKTWKVLSTPESTAQSSVSGISCPTSDVCYIDGSGCPNACRDPLPAIYKTTDAGAHWQKLLMVRKSKTTSTIGVINCPTVSVCYAGGSPSVMFKTGNGGMTWQELIIPGYYDISQISCLTTTNCFAVAQGCQHDTGSCGTSPSGTTYEISVIFSTTDGGASWVEHDIWLPIPVEAEFPCVGACLESAAILSPVSCNETACYVVGEAGAVVRSTDNFTHWQRQNTPADADLWTVACMRRGTCYVGGGGGSILTTQK